MHFKFVKHFNPFDVPHHGIIKILNINEIATTEYHYSVTSTEKFSILELPVSTFPIVDSSWTPRFACDRIVLNNQHSVEYQLTLLDGIDLNQKWFTLYENLQQ